ncbi:acyltransferase [uncultured Mucilaginibacter sp.]|uniref:acyltransferase family protein n=1 Tax=uncultured Mucilaginibacter sp. TaxID=797541 RepID=UPI0025E0D45E|nr:acyltransferase [uncultured Mucilaginibacter sp.]
MLTPPRNYTIDAFRLIGAFSVVIIHTIGAGTMAGGVALQTMHWAVAFFFMASGYFFFVQYSKAGLDIFFKTLINLIGIFIVVNLVFAAFHFASGTLRSSFSVYTFISYGTNFHLWFLNSLIGTYMAWWILFKFKLQKFLIPLAILMYGYNLVTEAYPLLLKPKFALFASNAVAFPLMTVGYYLAKKRERLSAALGIRIAIAGYLFQFIEIGMINYYHNVQVIGYHLGISTRLYAMGIFIYAVTSTGLPSKLSDYGRKYSLPIYLYHPIVISVLYSIIKPYINANSVDFQILYPIASIAISFIIIYCIEKWFKRLFRAINGSIGLQKLFTAKKQSIT